MVIRIILRPKREQIRRSFCSLAVRRAIISSNVTNRPMLLHQIIRCQILKMHMENIGNITFFPFLIFQGDILKMDEKSKLLK